jgi:hypothetical protein
LKLRKLSPSVYNSTLPAGDASNKLISRRYNQSWQAKDVTGFIGRIEMLFLLHGFERDLCKCIRLLGIEVGHRRSLMPMLILMAISQYDAGLIRISFDAS